MLAINDQQPWNQGYLDSKRRLAQNKQPVKIPQNPLERVPPGQRACDRLVPMPPIGHAYPHISQQEWQLRVFGAVEQKMSWNWDTFARLPHQNYTVDFHCVTHWSKLGQVFTGVPLSVIFELARPKSTVRFVIFECYDGYTTNLLYQELLEQVGFIATQMDGKDIEDRYGGPSRVVVPHLYGWKSAKFVNGIRFQTEDEPGFWEVRGYHNHGDPWKEERFQAD